MRKSLLAAALAMAFPLVQAQGTAPSSLELYGILDVGLERVDVGSATANRVSSGMSAGSRIGFRGRENLGNGWAALFTLETRLEADTGSATNRGPIFYCDNAAPSLTNPTGVTCAGVTVIAPATALPAATQAGILSVTGALNQAIAQAVTTVNGANALFDRQAFAGLITPVGAVIAGRQYTPGYEVLNKFNSFGDATAGQFGQAYSTIAIRANNAVQYRAEIAGVTASLMYGFGGTDANRGERTTDPRAGDDFIGANLQYATPVFSVGVGYNKSYTVIHRTAGAAAAQNNTKQTGLETLNVGATVTMGPVRVFAQYMDRKNENPVLRPEELQNVAIANGAGAAAALNALLAAYPFNPWDVDGMRGLVGPSKTKIYHLGATWNVGPGTLHAAYNNAKDTARSAWATEDAKVDHFGLAYFYNLSKRSQLYGAYALANNKGQSRMALAAAGYAGGLTTAVGEDASVMQLGIRHAF